MVERSEVVGAALLRVGDLVYEPWSGIVAPILAVTGGPRKVNEGKGAKWQQALLPDEVELEFGSPANCATKVKCERLMRRMLPQ